MLFALLFSLVIHLAWNLLAYKLDRKKLSASFGQEEMASYTFPGQKNYNRPDDAQLTLYKDHYEVIKHNGEECGCIYIGTYQKSNDSIYFDSNIIQSNLNINTNIFIELTDSTICPVNSSETVLIKWK